MALTLEQIAKIAGVSRSTASRVINERPGVRPAVRERVWQVIGEYDYVPNNNARLLATRRFGDTGSNQLNRSLKQVTSGDAASLLASGAASDIDQER